MTLIINAAVTQVAHQFVAQIPDHRLLVCRKCQYAVWPEQARSYFRGPNHRLPQEIIADIGQVADSWTHLIQKPSELELPQSIVQPIEHIELIFDGRQFQVDPHSCQYICRSDKAMKKHFGQQHGVSQYSGRGRPSNSQQRQKVVSITRAMAKPTT